MPASFGQWPPQAATPAAGAAPLGWILIDGGTGATLASDGAIFGSSLRQTNGEYHVPLLTPLTATNSNTAIVVSLDTGSNPFVWDYRIVAEVLIVNTYLNAGPQSDCTRVSVAVFALTA